MASRARTASFNASGPWHEFRVTVTYWYRPISSVTLWPPKPNVLFIAY